MDPISALIAVALFGAGWLLGRHARLKAGPKQPKPICMCGHHYGAHDPETGACNGQHNESIQKSPGGWYQDVLVDCACLRYTGPQPIEQYWVPPAADMNIVTAPREIHGGRDA